MRRAVFDGHAGHALELLRRSPRASPRPSRSGGAARAAAQARRPRGRRRSRRSRATRAAAGGSRARSGAPRRGSAGAAGGPGLCRESTIGSLCPGTNTSSIRFASAITATRGRSYACIAASAAESCPLPPSITTRFGAVANDASCVSPVPSESRAKRREITSAIAAKSSGSSPAVLDPELAVVGLPRQRVLEDDHRADRILAHRVRDVVALDAERQRLEVQRLAQLLERLDAPRALLLGRRLLGRRARAARSRRRAPAAAASRRARRRAPRRARRASPTGTRRAPRGRRPRAARRSAAARSAPSRSTRGRTPRAPSSGPGRSTFSRWNECRSTILPPRSGKICTTARSPSAANPITSTVPTDCRSTRLPLDEVLHREEPVAVARRVLEALLAARPSCIFCSSSRWIGRTSPERNSITLSMIAR